MATYTPNFAQEPKLLLLGLVNNDNSKGYGPADVDIQNLQVLAGDHASGKNTSVDIDLLIEPSEVVGDFVTFNYDRMDVATVFSAIVAASKHNIREIQAIDTDGSLIVADFIAEVLRKYGFAFNTADYTFEMPTANQIKVTAKAGNLAYIGEVTFTVDAALRTRIADTDVSGFTKENIDLDPSDD